MGTALVTTSPDTMGGTPVFAGTRVPVQTLFDFLRDGYTIDRFLDGFPTVTREQALAVLRESQRLIIERASPREAVA